MHMTHMYAMTMNTHMYRSMYICMHVRTRARTHTHTHTHIHTHTHTVYLVLPFECSLIAGRVVDKAELLCPHLKPTLSGLAV